MVSSISSASLGLRGWRIIAPFSIFTMKRSPGLIPSFFSQFLWYLDFEVARHDNFFHNFKLLVNLIKFFVEVQS
jgi:hypothetical protein